MYHAAKHREVISRPFLNWAILFPLGGTKADENHEETHQLPVLPKIKCAHLDGHYQVIEVHTSHLHRELSQKGNDSFKALLNIPIPEFKVILSTVTVGFDNLPER